MLKNQQNRTFQSIVEFCLWTIRHHDQIVSSLRTYMFAATLLILLLAVSGSVHIRSACHAIIIGSLFIGFLIWIFSEARKAILLAIEDPDLKEKAHRIMLLFMKSHHIGPGRLP